MKREVYIVRHGSTELNEQGKLRGWQDVPLSKEGIAQVKKTAQELKDSGIKQIVSSDLQRAKQTAEALSKTTGAPTENTIKLRPWDVGKLSGQDSKDSHPILIVHATKTPDKKLDGGESFNQFKARFFGGLKEIFDKHSNGLLAVVTHHRGERLLKAWDKAGQPADHSMDLNTFFQVGETTGHAEKMAIDERKLAKGKDVSEDRLRGAMKFA